MVYPIVPLRSLHLHCMNSTPLNLFAKDQQRALDRTLLADVNSNSRRHRFSMFNRRRHRCHGIGAACIIMHNVISYGIIMLYFIIIIFSNYYL